MDTKQKLKDLQATKDKLLKEQSKLIKAIRDKHPDIYKWFVDRRIDLANLGDDAKKITAALAIAITIAKPSSESPRPQPKPEPEVLTITKSELRKLTEPERAQLVWDRYGSLIHHTAAKYDLDPNLIFATIMIESGGDAHAIRQEPRINDASYGLGQLLYGTARGIGYRGTAAGLFDPETNIDLIGKYHKRNFDHYEGGLTPEQLTIAYNTGSPYKRPWPGHIKKFYKWYHRTATLEVDLS